MEWIKFSEKNSTKLIKSGQGVLFAFPSGLVVNVYGERSWHLKFGSNWPVTFEHTKERPTHWMPLPEPPKEEK